jgi:uncharacterized protein
MARREQPGDNRELDIYRKVTLGIAGALGLAGGLLAYASFIEPRTILLREFDLELPTLPDNLNGLRFAFLSDFHLGGPGDPLGSIRRAIKLLEQERPDLIFLGGDYFDRGVRVPGEPEWARFPAIAPTFGVPGNHDYHRGHDTTMEIFKSLERNGIDVLRNEVRDLEICGQTVRLIGLDDPYTGRNHFDKARRSVDGAVHPTIMLAHAGLVADNLPIGSADLILSGHTHGAQVRISPFRHTGPLDVFWWLDYLKKSPISRFRQGLFSVRGSLLYVGNGLGTTSLGIRFMAAPEVAIFRLFRGVGRADRSCDDPQRYVRNTRTSWLRHTA